MPEYRGVIERTFYANIGVVAESKKVAEELLRYRATFLKPDEYDVEGPISVVVSPLIRHDQDSADPRKDSYDKTLDDVMSEETYDPPA